MNRTTEAPECLRPGRRRDTVRAMGGPAIELRHVSKRFLTPSGTAYTALRDLINDESDRELWAVAAQQRARGFAREAMAARYAALYREMAGSSVQREVA